MKRRSIRRFNVEDDIWPTVDMWVDQNGYRLKKSGATHRTYKKGFGVLVAPTMLMVNSSDNEVEIQVWIQPTFISRLLVIFLIPSEMGIESGGFRLAMPRRTARNAVNSLLALLGQSLIL